jgi:phosphate starvation-inducible protein PhoH
LARRQLEVSNEVAAELAGSQDLILRTLEEHLECDVFLRGNVITLDGDADAVQADRVRAVGRARVEHADLGERDLRRGDRSARSPSPG